MSAPLFYQRGQGLSVREIAALTGSEPRGGVDLDRRVTGIALLDRASSSDLTFLDKSKYRRSRRGNQVRGLPDLRTLRQTSAGIASPRW